MAFVAIRHLYKEFDGIPALENVHLEIEEGEFFALLGPSGCGKTTTMRCIAGFESPTSGTIEIGGEDVSRIPANRRSCGMVSQSYALFPHMTVFENVAYSLNIRRFYRGGLSDRVSVLAGMLNRKLGRVNRETEEKVQNYLKLVELSHLGDRLPGQLSGGQQQRVALARALIMEPAVLLMDEPLSNLDKKLRNSMRVMIRDIQKKVGITTLFVTHDQEEAMSMADRVAVMSEGKVIQVDTPSGLYSHPAHSFVADFVGSSNILRGEVFPADEGEGSWIIIPGEVRLRSDSRREKGEAMVLIRPESLTLLSSAEAAGQGENRLSGSIRWAAYFGAKVRYGVDLGPFALQVDTVYRSGEPLLQEGDAVMLTVEPNQVVVL
ncbi:ABC transporter ATP-binding protein [Paludifilum halophilum]|uniref:ABC transporter ATP-binding protein n=1 Tax=Paludifilum halophilum TaxID=1642702 RepID=A0A235B693_9BACL|nr:ABC transporter ATP-binding protein [Paludifilum halophilum]OYD07810.1 ABC transporter ATP-binding protein [Paludifilum halophilum]